MQKPTLVISNREKQPAAKEAKPAAQLYAIIGTGQRQSREERAEAIRKALMHC